MSTTGILAWPRTGRCARDAVQNDAMEVRELEAFLAVARELHFARAAESLNITQPALSRRIQSLEHGIDARLFVRDRRSVELTTAGQALVRPATEAVEAMKRAAATGRAAGKGEIGRVRVAYAGTSSQSMVADLARHTADRHPNLTVELMSANFALPLIDKVVRGDVDIAFGRWNYIPAGVSTRVVALESLVLAVPSEHPIAERPAVSMDQLREVRWITLPSTLGSVLIGHLRRLAAEAGFVPDVVQEAPDTWTVLSLVEAGIGCSLTLSSVAANTTNPRVTFIPLSDETNPVEVRMAWRDDSNNPAQRSLLTLAAMLYPAPT